MRKCLVVVGLCGLVLVCLHRTRQLKVSPTELPASVANSEPENRNETRPLAEQARNVIAYGQEFWRPGTAGKENVNLADAIDRVSHAIGRDEPMRAAFHTYSVEFTPDAMSIVPYRPGPSHAEPDPETRFSLKTTGVRAGDEVLAAENTSQWSITGNTAQRQLGSVIEHYETRANGIELSWVLMQRPRTPEAVEVEAECSGLAYKGQTERGFHFADAAGVSRVRVGNAEAVDTTGRRWALAMQARGNSLRIDVPAYIIDAATFPLAIDPVISPEFGMDQPIPSPADDKQDNPSIAFNGQHYLVVWQDGRIHPNEEDIFGTRVAVDGGILDPYGILISSAAHNQRAPMVATLGGEFLVVWRDYRNGANVFGTRVSAEGVILDEGGFQIGSNVGASRFDVKDVGVAASSNGYLVVWTDRRNQATHGFDIYGARVSPAGTVRDAEGIPICHTANIQEAVAIAGNGENFLVAWEDRRNSTSIFTDIYGTLVSADGEVLHPNGLAINTGVHGQRQPVIASDGRDYLVVWNEGPLNEPSHVDGTRVSGAGTLLDAGPIRILSSGVTQPTVSCNGDVYLVGAMWFTSGAFQAYGARVKTSGNLLDATMFRLGTPGTDTEIAPFIATDGTNFLVAWTRSPGGSTRSGIEARRVNADGVADPVPLLLSVAAHGQDAPAVAAIDDQFLVVWADSRHRTASSSIDIYGVRVTTNGSVLDPNGIAICTAATNQVNPAVAANGVDYLVVWQDGRHTTNNYIFGTRVTRAGEVINPNGQRICAQSSDQRNPAVAASGGDFMVVWENRTNAAAFTDIYGARVQSDGALPDLNGFVVSAAAGGQSVPAIASDGTDYLVAWSSFPGTSFVSDIYGARVSGSAALLDPDGLAICLATNSQFTPAIAYNGSNYLVVWADFRTSSTNGSDIFGTPVTVSGIVSVPDGIQLVSSPNTDASPAIGAFGSRFLLVWSSQQSGPFTAQSADILGIRLDAAGERLDTDPLAINTNSLLRLVPAVARGANNFLVASRGLRDGALRIVGNIVDPRSRPQAQPQTLTVFEDTSLPITLTGAADGDLLSFAIVASPAHGTLNGTPPNVTYVPAADYFGSDHFLFTVRDSETESAPVQVQITVVPVNDAPSFHGGRRHVSVAEDAGPQRLAGWAKTMRAGPSNESSQGLQFVTTVDNPRLFSVQPAVNSRGTLTFTPARDAHGKASIAIVLQDDGGTENGGVNKSPPVTLRITIRPVNDAPRAQSQTVSTLEDQNLQITLAASDPEGDRLTWKVTAPRHGMLFGKPPHLIYKPAPDFFGWDSFTYQVKDGSRRSAVATVRIQVTSVNDAPLLRARLFGEIPALAILNPVVVSPNGSNAAVVFDASHSSDAENDPLEFAWFSVSESAFALGFGATNTVELGSHRVVLQASDGSGEATQHLDFEVISPAQAAAMLLVMVDDAIPNWRTKRPLIFRLRAAMNSFEAGEIHPGVRELRALQSELRSLIATDPNLATRLIDATGAIIQTLSAPTD